MLLPQLKHGIANVVLQDKRWWDYRALFRSRSSCYRLACNCVFAIFAQWAGNGALTYFLPAVLTTAGYTNSITQANINLGYACFQFVFALTGAAFVDRFGRRPLMLFSMGGCALVWVAVTAATASYAESGNTNTDAARATVAFIFIFGAVYSFGITPLQALYPVEVLSFEMRAKGMAFSSLAVNAGSMLNQYAWPVSLKAIGWHTYIIFMIWCAIEEVVFYFFLPETKNRTVCFSLPLPLPHQTSNTDVCLPITAGRTRSNLRAKESRQGFRATSQVGRQFREQRGSG